MRFIQGSLAGLVGLTIITLQAQTTLQWVSPRSASSNPSQAANGNSTNPSFSPQGDFLIFTSDASNLLEEVQGTSYLDVYRYEFLSGRLELISRRQDGTASGNGNSSHPSISPDGRWIAFASYATGLTDHPLHFDPNQSSDIFLHDLESGTTELISRQVSSDVAAGGGSYDPVFSTDGRYLFFESDAANLVTNDSNHRRDIFAYSLQDKTIELLSIAYNAETSPSYTTSNNVLPGSNAAYAVFTAIEERLESVNPLVEFIGFSEDSDARSDLYVRSLGSATTQRIELPVLTDFVIRTILTIEPKLAKARPILLFQTLRPGSGPQDYAATHWIDLENQVTRILRQEDMDSSGFGYIHQSASQMTEDGSRVIATLTTGPEDGPDYSLIIWSPEADEQLNLELQSTRPGTLAISPKGTYAGYQDLIDGNFYLYDGKTGAYLFSMPLGTMANITFNASETQLAFHSATPGFFEGDDNRAFDVFTLNIESALNGNPDYQLVSRPAESKLSVTSLSPADYRIQGMTQDGGGILISTHEALVEQDNNGTQDVYVINARSGEATLISVNAEGTAAGNRESEGVSLSRDGKKVLFKSRATNLVTEFNVQGVNAYLRDVELGETQIVNLNESGLPFTIGTLTDVNAEDNYRYFGFIMDGSSIYRTDILRRGPSTRIDSSSADQVRASRIGWLAYFEAGSSEIQVWNGGDSTSAFVPLASFQQVPMATTFSHDELGRFLYIPLLSSLDNNHVLKVNTAFLEIDYFTLESPFSFFDRFDIDPESFRITPDGRHWVVVALASRDGSPFVMHRHQIIWFDRETGEQKTVTLDPKGESLGNGNSSSPVISDDGRFVAFQSKASNLVANDRNPSTDIFLRDMFTGTTRILSKRGDALSYQPWISGDGSTVVFSSFASNFLSEDRNRREDLFLATNMHPDILDTDRDGLDDEWERSQFGNLDQNAGMDFDQDGVSNLNEFLAGTNAADPESLFLGTLVFPDEQGNIQIRWHSIPTQRYQVQFKDNIASTNWNVLIESVEAEGNETVVTDTLPTPSGNRYYRIVKLPN